MRLFSKLVSFVDRDVNRWAGSSILVVVAVFPILLLDLLYEGPPENAPRYAMAAALIASAAIGLFIIWREIIFHIREFRALRAQAEREAENDPR